MKGLLLISILILGVTSSCYSYQFRKNSKNIDIEQVYKLVAQEHIRNKLVDHFDNTNRRASCDIGCSESSILIPKPGHISKVNGCGSYNISIDFTSWNMREFTECCNVHDVCYEDCYKTQDVCDKSFETCLLGHCERWAIEHSWNFAQRIACTGTGKLMYLAVKNLGCSAYKLSREDACQCSN